MRIFTVVMQHSNMVHVTRSRRRVDTLHIGHAFAIYVLRCLNRRRVDDLHLDSALRWVGRDMESSGSLLE